ncbi:uncharacterized protein LOC106154549 [Lingula anatina]|uniref:Uncharacterized protein LOC106154549 n=1 Tax=Lingula anatina TaxID=7574 RepID=A0A1S3HEF5_LINAN|nr:uncharacterized protein LOC106154549 [Lingula anatina]|eukprot:XP_013384390.1 uncharacterized protein LOC106154549 [Lingula anatina]
MTDFLSYKQFMFTVVFCIGYSSRGNSLEVNVTFEDNTVHKFGDFLPNYIASDSLIFKCNANITESGATDFGWYLNKKPIYTSDKPGHPSSHGRFHGGDGPDRPSATVLTSTLIYPNVTVDQSGEYTCELNGVKGANATKSVYIIDVLTNVTGQVDRDPKNVTLECVVYNWLAHDPPIFSKGSKELGSDGKKYIKSKFSTFREEGKYRTGSANSLVILNAGPEDIGEYKCSVTLKSTNDHTITRSMFVTAPNTVAGGSKPPLVPSVLWTAGLVVACILWILSAET